MTLVRDEREIEPGIFGWLESPSPFDPLNDCFTVDGWAFSRTVPLRRVLVRGVGPERPLQYHIEREDVANAYPADSSARRSGFSGFVEVDSESTRPRHLEIWAALEDGRELRLFRRRLFYATYGGGGSPFRAFVRQSLLAAGLAPHSLLSIRTWITGLRGLTRALSGHQWPVPLVGGSEPLAAAHSAALRAFLSTGTTLTLPLASTPRVSVVIVVWNRAELTFRCLRALSEGTYPALELIVVDNKSSDETLALLERTTNITVIRNASNLGFTVAANQGAGLARGEFILFLNSDAEPLPGSLAALVDTLSQSTAIGAVGGKLVFPDGTLQEAGGIVWPDGSCESYGRGRDPSAPEFCFERDVDYCSGAFLLTRRETFQAFGGFDECYRPAYYEDVDYCVRLWKGGLRVVYQGAAVAIHLEFGSSPSRADAIRMQIARRSMFTDVHREWLVAQPSRAHGVAAAANKRRSRRSALFIDDILPDPKRGAGFPRAVELLRALQGMGFDLTLYATTESPPAASSLFRRVEVVRGRGPTGIRQFLDERQGQYDVIVVSRPHNMRYLKAAVGSQLVDAAVPVIYDAEAISAIRTIRRRRLWGEQVLDEEANRLIREETALARGSAVVLAVSPDEQRHFTEAGVASAMVLGHSVRPCPTSAQFHEREGLLFVGAFDPSSPNEDAVRFLVEAVMPAVAALIPEGAPLCVAGSNIPDQVLCMTGRGVSFHADVDDLSPLYCRSRVFVAPIRYAAGIPLKVIEAASRGLPVVASRLLADQLGWASGAELLTADTPGEYAAAIQRLYCEPELWERLRTGGLNRVASDCDPQKFRATIGEALQASRLVDEGC